MPSLREVVKFILYVLLQIFVFKDLILFGYAMSFVYILFFIGLNSEMNRGALMLIGFFMGLIIDMFYRTGGVHAFSTVFITYIRPFLINRFLNIDQMKKGEPLIKLSSSRWVEVAVYSLIVVFIHHFLVLFIEASSFHLFLYTLGKIICSTIFTYLLFLMGNYLFVRSAS